MESTVDLAYELIKYIMQNECSFASETIPSDEDAQTSQEAARLCRGDEIRSAVLSLEGKAVLNLQNCVVAGQVDDVGLKLANLLLQLLKAAQIAGGEGHVLAANGPEQYLLFLL